MDKVTKGFVIAACSVVIATPIVWFGGQVLEARRQAEVQAQELKDQAERSRRVSRAVPCKDRADELNPIHWTPSEESMTAQIKANAAFISRCVASTMPVEVVK